MNAPHRLTMSVLGLLLLLFGLVQSAGADPPEPAGVYAYFLLGGRLRPGQDTATLTQWADALIAQAKKDGYRITSVVFRQPEPGKGPASFGVSFWILHRRQPKDLFALYAECLKVHEQPGLIGPFATFTCYSEIPANAPRR